jgi:integrase/recombinase XerD
MTPTNYPILFEQFLQEKQYIAGVSVKTIRTYRDSWKAFQKYQGEISFAGVKQFVITANQSGVSVGAINTFARSVNSFLTWLNREGHISEAIKIPKVKQPKREILTYSIEDAKKILSHKPRNVTEKRLLTILALLIDCGLRINEALSLTRDRIDFDNLLIRVIGKGDKERVVPFSLESRKILFRWMQSHERDIAFPTKDGRQLRYDNLRIDFLALLDRVGVEKSEGAFHAFRRFAARSYLRNGGNIRYLQLLLGHADIKTTTRYLDTDSETLRKEHSRLSPLEALKRR